MNMARMITAKIVLVILLAIVVFCSDIPRAIAGDYLGEFCWSFLKTENENGPKVEGPVLMRAGVTYVGGAYYTLQGISGISDPVIFGGTATIVGNKVYMTLNETQGTSQWRDSGIIQVQLDISTLNGNLWDNYVSFKTNTHEFGAGYAAGTMTFTACP
jgi:hypothetical protein